MAGVASHEPRAVTAALPSDPGGGWVPPAPGDALRQLVEALERWGELFLRMADADRVPAAEQVLGGLVDWMGNGLLDGWLHLPIPRFEGISDLAEELFRACQAYLVRLQQATPACPVAERLAHAVAVRTIVARAQALTVPNPQSPVPNPQPQG
jgi:hypothetical protein